MFNAVAIEHAFAAFTGDYSRLGVVDADVFRAGDPKDLGALLILFAQRLRQRTEFLEFTPGEARNGGPSHGCRVALSAWPSKARS